MANEQVLLSVPTESPSDTVEVSVIFNEGSTHSWAGDEIEKGYHLHVNAVSNEGSKKRIRPFTGLRRFIAQAERFNAEEVQSLNIGSNTVSTLVFSVARANDLKLSKQGAKELRAFKHGIFAEQIEPHKPSLKH